MFLHSFFEHIACMIGAEDDALRGLHGSDHNRMN
jgi:hypothetical protein